MLVFNNWQYLCGVYAVLGGTGLGKDFEIDKAHGHEAEGETGHQTGEEDQENDDEYVDEEIGAAAFVFDGHSIRPTVS